MKTYCIEKTIIHDEPDGSDKRALQMWADARFYGHRTVETLCGRIAPNLFETLPSIHHPMHGEARQVPGERWRNGLVVCAVCELREKGGANDDR